MGWGGKGKGSDSWTQGSMKGARKYDDSARKLTSFDSIDESDEEEEEDEPGMRDSPFLRCLCKPWMLCAIAVAVVCYFIAAPVARRIAELVIDDIGVGFESIDLGVLGGSQEFHPMVVGWVSPIAMPCSLVATLNDASVWAHLSHTDEAHTRIGLLTMPELSIAPFKQTDLNMNMTLSVEIPDNLGLAADDFIISQTTTWRVKALVDVKIWVLGFIPMRLKGIALNKEIQLKGMAAFDQANNPLKMIDIVDASGEADGLDLDVSVVLHNPSFIAATVQSEMIFGVETRGQKFGIATVNGLRLVPGDNTVTLHFKLLNTPGNEHAVEEFMGGYIRTEKQIITVIGNKRSSLDPLMGVILQEVKFDVTFIPPTTQFVQHVVARVSPTGLNAKVKVYNPLPKGITLQSLALDVFLQDSPDSVIFALDTAQSQTAVPGTMLQPKTVTEIVIDLSIFGAKIGAVTEIQKIVEEAKSGNIVVTVRGPVSFRIEPSFPMTVPYSDGGIECHLGWCVFCM